MRIAVVDDEKDVLEKVYGGLKKIESECSIDIDIDCFANEELLLMNINENKMYDAYLLDIELKHLDGITLAKKIRKRQNDAYIIFITNYMRYAIEGYDVKAYQYILKDRLDEKLLETIKLIYNDFIERYEKYFIIQTSSRYEKILYRDICYIYKEHKNSVFVTKNGKSQVRMTLQDVYGNLLQEEFIYIDRGYIVNMRYIKKFQKQEIILVNDDILPVSKPHMAEVKVKIGRYWKERM